MKSLRCSPFQLALCLFPLVCGLAYATPREELIRLVPGDVGFCLVIGDLRAHHEKLLRSPWIKAVANSPFGKALRNAPEVAQLRNLEAQLRKGLNVTWAQLRDDILGDAVVLVYRPGPPGKPDDEQGALMLWARDPALLARLVNRLNAEQQKAGEVKEVQARTYKRLTYHRRVEGEGESFYYLDGPVLIFTAQEAMLRQMLDRRADPKAPAALPMTTRLREVGTDKALASLWINPRAFDAELRQQVDALEGEHAHALKTFLGYWKALDGVSVALTLERDPEVVLGVHARLDELPPAARRLFATAGQPSELWGRFPKDSIFTFAARVDLGALTEALGEFLTPEARSAVAEKMQRTLGFPTGQAIIKQVLPSLGPDCGLCIAAPPDRASFPHVLIAVRLQPGKGPEPFDKSVMNTLKLFAALAVLDHNLKNKDAMQLRKVVQDGVEVHYFVSDKKFPKGMRPAFALKDGYLLLASSPDAVRRFASPAVAVPKGKDAPLMRLSLQQLGRLLKERRDVVLDFLTFRSGQPRDRAGKQLDGLLVGLELFESLELTQRTEGQRVSWVVRLRPAQFEAVRRPR